MKSKKGQEAVEVALLMGLIFIVVIVCLFMFGNKISDFFKTGSSVVRTSQGGVAQLNSDTVSRYSNATVSVQAGSLGGSAAQPATNCNDSSCVIDFGTFVLNTPKNFNNSVQTLGASGGTDAILVLINQISSQLAEEGLTEQSDAIKKLSNLGHNIAVIEKNMNDMVISCNYDSTCIGNYLDQKQFAKPAGYDETYGKFPEGLTYREIIQSISLGYVKSGENSSYCSSGGNLAGCAFSAQLDVVKNQAGLSDNIKGVIQELYWDIGTIGEDFKNSIQYSLMGQGNPFYDPLTGKNTTGGNCPTSPVDDFKNYSASKISHFDSSLICASGKYVDNNTSCH